MTVLHLVRHGQSTWNVEGRLQGQSDEAVLTERGREQAASAAALLADPDVATATIGRLLTSDLARARQTAEIIAAAIGLTPMASALLREQDLGEWEGLTTAEAMERHTALGAVGPDDLLGRHGESRRDVAGRVAALLASPLVTEAPGPVVLVTHGDTIRWALAHLLGDDLADVPWRDIPNGSVTTVTRADDIIIATCRTVDGEILRYLPDYLR